MTPDERKGVEELLAGGYTGNAATIAWLKRQLEHNDWDNSIERMGGGKKARDAYSNPIFDAACAVTAFDMHAQLTGDGRERGLWIWLLDESKARAEIYDKWAADALAMFCTMAGIDDETSEKFRLSTAIGGVQAPRQRQGTRSGTARMACGEEDVRRHRQGVDGSRSQAEKALTC